MEYCAISLLYILWRASRSASLAGRVRRVLSRGFCWLSRARALSWHSLFGHTLSERCGCSTPRGFAYCKSPRGRRFSSPVGQYCSHALRQSLSGIARPFPHRLVSAEPRALRLGPAPSATPWRFRIQTKGMSTLLTRLFGVRDRTTLIRNHTLSPTLSGHTPQWLANYSVLTAEGGRSAYNCLIYLFAKTSSLLLAWCQPSIGLGVSTRRTRCELLSSHS